MTDTDAPVQEKPKASVSERSSPKTPTAKKPAAKKPKKAAAQKSPVKKIAAPSKAASATKKPAEEPKDADPIFGYPATDAVPKARTRSKKRKFAQTWDLAINLKGMNLKKPENRFNLEYALPAGRGKPVKVGVIVDTLATEAKKLDVDLVITKQEIPGIVKNKKLLKKIANEIDWFYGEVSLMPLIGKSFGVVLGPRGKVPKPIPPKANL